MAIPLDPTKKRDLSLPQQIGRNARQAVDTTVSGFSAANPIAVGTRGFNDAVPRLHKGVREAAYGFTNPEATSAPSVARPAAPPVRNPASRVPTGGVPASLPRPAIAQKPAMPDFSGVRGSAAIPAVAQPTGLTKTRDAAGNLVVTGTGAYAAGNTIAAPAAAAQRPLLHTPSIAPVSAPGVLNESENTDQRRAREAAISEIGSQLFLNRGKTTRSARDLTGDLLRTQADLTNTAGNQAAAMKNNNLDAQTRMAVVGLQNQGENDRAVVKDFGESQRASLLDAGATDRERIKLERPSLLTDRDGGYLLVNPAQGVARPVLSNGQQVHSLVDGAITPVDRLTSLQEELNASQESLTPDPVRIGALQNQVDALRSGASQQQAGSTRPASVQEFMAKAKAANPNASDADLRAYYEKTYGSAATGRLVPP